MSEESEEFDVINEIPDDLSLPEYIPLPSSSLREIQSLVPMRDEVKSIQNTLNKIRLNIEDFIKFIIDERQLDNLSNVEKVLGGYKSSLETLLSSLAKFEIWREVCNAAKSKYQNAMHEEPEFQLSTLAHYRESEELPLYEYVKNEYLRQILDMSQQQGIFNQRIINHDTYKYLESVAFILRNPEDPLPDKSEGGSDEIEVSGGKVSLLDPITLHEFVEPVKSRSCNHVFEKQAIQEHLKSGHNCPVDGCEKRILANDLVPDVFMTLRILAVQFTDNQADADLVKL